MFRKLVLTLALVLTTFLAIASTAFAVFPPLEPRSVAGPASAHGFVLSGDSISTGLAATAGDPTLVSLMNSSRGAVDITLAEITCPNDPLCSMSPIFAGRMIAEVAIAGTGATDIALSSRAAPFTATLRYDKSIVPALNVSALHVYADGTGLRLWHRDLSSLRPLDEDPQRQQRHSRSRLPCELQRSW